MFKITVSGNTFQELQSNMALVAPRILGQNAAQDLSISEETIKTDKVETASTEPAKRGRKKAEDKPEAPAEKVVYRANDEIMAAKEKAKAETKLEYATDIRPLVLQIGDGDERLGLGRPKIEELLKRFGVAKAPLLKPEQLADFKQEAEDILNKAKLADDYA